MKRSGFKKKVGGGTWSHPTKKRATTLKSKRIKAIPISKVEKELDKYYQLVLKTLNPTCLACNRPSQVIHHYVPKGQSNRLRYDPLNAASLCNGCHFSHHIKNDPDVHWKIEQKWGVERVNLLQTLRREVVKKDRQWYQSWRAVLDGLKAFIS